MLKRLRVEPISRILVDMDEVIVDFRSGACKLHGVCPKEMNRRTVDQGVWGMDTVLGLTADQFWQPIHEAGVAFWLDLKPLPWAYALMEVVERKTEDWHVVTAPSRGWATYTGKVRWLKWFFGEHFDSFLITPHKHVLAQEGVVLIDDREENLSKFIGGGGSGILFPSWGNKLHAMADNPVEYVAGLLNG